MDIAQSMEQFIAEQFNKFPELTERDVKQLQIGFTSGCEYFIRHELEALEAKEEAL